MMGYLEVAGFVVCLFVIIAIVVSYWLFKRAIKFAVICVLATLALVSGVFSYFHFGSNHSHKQKTETTTHVSHRKSHSH